MLFLAQDKIVKLGILNAMSEERLDRIESLIEKIGQKVESNAKNIEPTFRRLVSKVNNIFGTRNRGKTEYVDVQGLS